MARLLGLGLGLVLDSGVLVVHGDAGAARVAGAFLAAASSRWRVMALRPTRMCLLMAGGGGGAS